MARILINDLASVLSERKKLNKKDATYFVSELFNLIQEGLGEDRLVKVKGLGTFKIIEVDDRESVNVNTGERVLIEGHGKISFTPDALMKDLVNKPFSQFETVVLNEGVDFADIQEETVSDDNQMTTERPDLKEEPLMIEDDEPAMVPLVDFTSESESVIESQPESEAISEVVSEPEERTDSEKSAEEPPIVEETSVEEPVSTQGETQEEEMEVESSMFNWKKWLLPVIFCVIVFVGGYLFGKFAKGQKEIIPEKVEQKPNADFKQTQADLKQSVEESPVAMEKDDAVAEKAQKEETVLLDKYEEMDIRVRTGAYRILGIDHIEKVKAGDNLTRICRRTIGQGMECYLEVFNDIKPNSELKAGDEIKIPKLELKKKKSKKTE